MVYWFKLDYDTAVSNRGHVHTTCLFILSPREFIAFITAPIIPGIGTGFMREKNISHMSSMISI